MMTQPYIKWRNQKAAINKSNYINLRLVKLQINWIFNTSLMKGLLFGTKKLKAIMRAGSSQNSKIRKPMKTQLKYNFKTIIHE